MTRDVKKAARLLPRSEFLTLLGAGAVAITLGGCRAGRNTLADTAARKAAEVPDDEAVAEIAALEGVMNLLRNGLRMRKTKTGRGPSRSRNPHSNAVSIRVHNTL